MTDMFHRGEIEMQDRAGERDLAIRNGRMIQDRIPERAAAFLAQQNFCALGWRARDGDLWAVWFGGLDPIACSSADGRRLRLVIGHHPPTWAAWLPPLAPGDDLGVLFIDLATRRRLRVNGVVAEPSNGELIIAVQAAFPNCAKFIQRRDASTRAVVADPGHTERGTTLTETLVALIQAADTFFVASGLTTGGMDGSHRGGNAGFVRVRDGRLRIPDYNGNSMFGTLGNFIVNPRAGLSFIDFAGERQLQMTGDVTVEPRSDDDIEATGGTGRWWTFTPRHWVLSALSPSLAWTPAENSPFNPGQGEPSAT
jgi:predicted pyridoxine 5'-phosphate oxidase superfamily flavin-nucleotide-binding protein